MREGQVDVREAGARDVALVPVERESFGENLCFGCQRRGIRTRVRFGERESREELP